MIKEKVYFKFSFRHKFPSSKIDNKDSFDIYYYLRTMFDEFNNGVYESVKQSGQETYSIKLINDGDSCLFDVEFITTDAPIYFSTPDIKTTTEEEYCVALNKRMVDSNWEYTALKEWSFILGCEKIHNDFQR